MKTILTNILITTCLLAGLAVTNAAEKIVGGPQGGRLLEKTSPRAEFHIEKNRTVTITFYDDKLQPIPAVDQVATLLAETTSGKTKIAMARRDGKLVSDAPLPPGEGYTVVIQLKAGETAKPQNFRVTLDLSTCGGCQRAEYACTCDH